MANGSKALVGKAGRFQVNDGYKYTFGAFMGCFRTNLEKADPGFTFYLLQTERYQRLIGDLLAGSSINNLKPSSIESLEFLFPERAEQLAIATVLSDIDAELTSLQNRRDSIQEVKQGMMQQLLTGKIRLR
jgi:type I restriction enzyme S subunit